MVPVLDEIEALPNNLSRLLADPTLDEVVVVDGGSTDGTLDFLRDLGLNSKLTVLESAPGRGRQMNLGAEHTSCEWLLFHHADSTLPDRAGMWLTELPQTVAWGGFKHQFGPSNWKLRMISGLHNWRWSITGAIYGDQSMFVRRDFFARLGGFVEEGLEDLEFSDRAQVQTSSHLLDVPVVTASRKFTQIGEFSALFKVLSILWRYERAKKIGHERFFLPYR